MERQGRGEEDCACITNCLLSLEAPHRLEQGMLVFMTPCPHTKGCLGMGIWMGAGEP